MPRTLGRMKLVRMMTGAGMAGAGAVASGRLVRPRLGRSLGSGRLTPGSAAADTTTGGNLSFRPLIPDDLAVMDPQISMRTVMADIRDVPVP
jgi:hypothetical protein